MADSSQEHAEIVQLIKVLRQDLEFHIAEVHERDVVPRGEFTKMRDELATNVEEIAEAVLGPRRTKFAGGGRKSSDGLAYKIDETSARLAAVEASTGEIKFGAKEWAAILVALISVVGTFMVVVFG